MVLKEHKIYCEKRTQLSYTPTLTVKNSCGSVHIDSCGSYTGTLTGVIDGMSSFDTFNKRIVLSCNVLICTMISSLYFLVG